MESTPWPDVQDLLSYWRVSPPVHVLVKAGFFDSPGQRNGEVGTKLTTVEELQAAIKGFEA